MKDASPGKRRGGRGPRRKPRHDAALVLNPPLSWTVIEDREEKPVSASIDRASEIRRYRGHLDHLVGRYPDALVDEMRGR